MNHIKILYDGKKNEFAHRKFVRYGMGVFERETMNIKFGKKNVQMNAGFEYVDVFFKFVVSLIKKYNVKEEIDINGEIIPAKVDIEKILKKFEIEPNKQTKKKVSIKLKMDSEKFVEFVENLEGAYLLLTIKSKSFQISTKKSIPKPGKLVEKFVSMKIDSKYQKDVIKEFLFDLEEKDLSNIVSAEIKHTYEIDRIDIPKKYENDPAKARVNAIRSGIIKRSVVVKLKNGEETINKQIQFSI